MRSAGGTRRWSLDALVTSDCQHCHLSPGAPCPDTVESLLLVERSARSLTVHPPWLRNCDSWELVYNHRAPSPLQQNNSKACTLHHVQGLSQGGSCDCPRGRWLDKARSTGYFSLLSPSLLPFGLSPLTSQINNIPLNPCPGDCFWGNPNARCLCYLSDEKKSFRKRIE